LVVGVGWITSALPQRIAALRRDCELIKMADFIDPFDYNSLNNRVVMLSGALQRIRSVRPGFQTSLVKIDLRLKAGPRPRAFGAALQLGFAQNDIMR
jgi:hypothetical protein